MTEKLFHEPKEQKNPMLVQLGGTPRCKYCGCSMEWLNTPLPDPKEECQKRKEKALQGE